MTPKENAKDLFNKFYMAIPSDEMGKCYKSSKQCALIAVDEILKAFRKDLPEIGLGKGYWGEVKQEIEKL